MVATLLEIHEVFLLELRATLWELHACILLDQTFVQLAKGFVLLAHHPSFFVIEADFNMVLGVGPMVDWIIQASGAFDLAI